MRKKFFVFTFLSLIGITVGTERLFHFLSDGFSIASISSEVPFYQAWEVVTADEDFREAQSALAQKYRYLASGSQSYVFVSEDDRYVIKFFRHKRWRISPLYTHFPLPTSWEKKRARWKRKKRETIHDTFTSFKTSYEIFKEDTGVLFVHLNQTNNLKKTITVKDRMGLKHNLQLDLLQFALQKKAVPTDQYLLNLREAGQIELAKNAIRDILLLTKKRAECGYSDKDPHPIRNFGFIEGKAVEIDIGGFHKDPKKGLEYYYIREIGKIQSKLLPWVEKHYPEIVPFSERQIEILESTPISLPPVSPLLLSRM